MTSPSHKKHRTTRRSTLRSIPSRSRSQRGNWCSLWVILAVICSPLLAEQPAGRLTPLDRLKQRSAHNRWQSAKRELSTSKKMMEAQPSIDAGHPQLNDLQQIPGIRTAEAVPDAVRQESAPSAPAPADLISSDEKSADPVTLPDAEHPVVTQTVDVPEPTPVTEQSLPSEQPAPTFPLTTSTPSIPSRETVQSSRDNPAMQQPAPRIVFDGQDQGRNIVVPPLTLGGDPIPVPPSPSSLEPIEGARPIELSQVPSDPSTLRARRNQGDLSNLLRPITEITPSADYRTSVLDGTEGAVQFANIKSPDVVPLPTQGALDRYFAPVNFQWQATNLHRNPLYFEDFALERYGHTYPDYVQPFVSVGKFGLQVAALPYTMALASPCNKEYSLGYLRPGDCNPTLMYQVPLDAQAAGIAAGTYTGLIFLFP